jgi:hypothetical protein
MMCLFFADFQKGIMMKTADKIEIAIMEAIESTGKNAIERKKRDAAAKGTDWKKETWEDSTGTKEVLDCLIALAREKNFLAAARKDKCTKADCSEWLYDLVWYDGPCGELRDVILAAEIEWATWKHTDKDRLNEILFDFEKLLIVRTEYRIIIFQGETNNFIDSTFERFEKSIRNYKRTMQGDRYLFVGWSWENQDFKFKHFLA